MSKLVHIKCKRLVQKLWIFSIEKCSSIDAFVRKHHLGRVDCIKLDVEGAEMLALSGGKETIAKLLPKLIVCLYHQPEDMVNIPLYIRKIAPSYKLYVAHSSAVFTDTILYARPA